MGFPAVWAAAVVGTHANGTATIVIATAETSEMVVRLKRGILSTFLI
jgi:hypothetical protein